MASLDEIRDGRIAKLELLRGKGIEPFPVSAHPGHTLKAAAEKFDALAEKGGRVTLAGRVLSIRGQGKLIFITINDGTGSFQGLLKSGPTPQGSDGASEPSNMELIEFFNDHFDIGDFVEATGTLFTTQRGEKTILVEAIRMLAKSLRPLPEKWEGLQDVEERFRKRYLDILSNSEARERFVMRSKIVTKLREILDREEFLEVETPALQPLYGGASAEPFVTHHNALDQDLYLRISDELYLKRLLVAGFSKVYEIARDFRNEGIDHTHNPEFTMLEFYEAYSDAPRQMAFVEKMLREVALAVSPSGVIVSGDKEIDFNKPFAVKKYADVLSEATGISDPFNASKEDLKAAAGKLGVRVEAGDSAAKILDTMFKKIRPTLIDPIFLVDYPVDMLPLTKRKDGEEKIVDAFQFYAGGIELVKAFSELNDPLDQRERFLAQEKVREGGETDAQPLDEEFLEAMEYGMPPAGGVGIGIDRLTMFFTNTENIKEVIIFPTLKPRN